ncbi:hypothetical protein CATMIT_01970, partial [Catenibacterium mitsuokai DSM 15897]
GADGPVATAALDRQGPASWRGAAAAAAERDGAIIGEGAG